MKRFGIAAILILYATVYAFTGELHKAEASTGVPQPAGKIEIRFQGERLSLDVVDAALTDVLRAIAQKTGVDLTLDEGITGRVSIQLVAVSIEEALKRMCNSSAFVYEYLPEKNGYRIIQAAAVAEALKEKTAIAAGPVELDSEPIKILSEEFSVEIGKQPGVRPMQPASVSKTAIMAKPGFKPGELLVKFKPDVTEGQIQTLHRTQGSTVIGSIRKLRLQRIKLRNGLSEDAAIQLYAGVDIVEQAEKHALRYPNLTPNDPYYGQQWGLARIAMPQAWEITQGSREVVIALIDSGVDYRHEDLKDNIWLNPAEAGGAPGVDDDNNGYIDDVRGWDFVGKDESNMSGGDADPMDLTGHGSHVAGIIAASGNNGLGIAGISWQVQIMPLKVQADNGTEFLTFAIIEAIQYAIDNGAKIVNCSFGGSEYNINEFNAFNELNASGILAVCAAGNDGRNIDLPGNEIYPAGYNPDNIIAVAAANNSDNLAEFSNYGSASVDVMAPGDNIYSTLTADAGTEARVRVEAAAPIEYPAVGMVFAGTTAEIGITASAYNCGKGYPEEFPVGVAGNIAVIERGSRDDIPFYFYEKVLNAKAVGAVGVIIYNNVVDDLDAGGGTLMMPGDWMPAVSITQANGLALIALGTPRVTVFNVPIEGSLPYGYLNGTSMAAPHVTGIAGLIHAQCPALGHGDVKTAILNSVDKVSAVEGKIASGGRVNALAALSNIYIPGDLSRDCRIGLADAILTLQILVDTTPSLPYPCLWCGKDVNGDSRIGSEEATFILQKVAGLRE